MTLYRILTAQVPCERCGQIRATDIQFRTGDEDNLEKYTADTRLMPGHGLLPNTVYTAQAERYCRSCLFQRKRDECQAFYASLGDLVASQRLTLLTGMFFKKPLSAEALHARGAVEADKLVDTRTKYPQLFSRLADYQVMWDNVRLEQGTAAYNDFLERVNEGIAERLVIRGWPPNNALIRRDWVVALTPEDTLTAQIVESAAVEIC